MVRESESERERERVRAGHRDETKIRKIRGDNVGRLENGDIELVNVFSHADTSGHSWRPSSVYGLNGRSMH